MPSPWFPTLGGSGNSFSPVLASDINWPERVKVDAIGDEARRGILEAVKEKLGFARTCEALGIAKSSLQTL